MTEKAGKTIGGQKNPGVGSTIGFTDDDLPNVKDAIKAGEIVPYGDYRPRDEPDAPEEGADAAAKTAKDAPKGGSGGKGSKKDAKPLSGPENGPDGAAPNSAPAGGAGEGNA